MKEYKVRIYRRNMKTYNFDIHSVMTGFENEYLATVYAEHITNNNCFCDIVEYRENGFRTVARTEEGRTFKF